MRCYKCGFLNPEEANFCLKCGAQLKAPEAEQRKFATILYSDLKEFTVLSERKDPEEVREIIKELFFRFDQILGNFHVGYHEYIGDAVLALFGVPTAYGDDAELGINAALSMQQEIKEFSEKIGLTLEIRIGINSGEVVYGEIPGKRTVTGDAVNTAQRLESIASPGKFLISDTTAKLVSGKFQIFPIPRLKLKGKKEEVIAFEVQGPKETYPVFLSPMVGRDEEFDKLKETLNIGADLEPIPTFTVVAGDIGVGKSRLIFEFQNYLDELIIESSIQIKVIPLRCWSYGAIYQAIVDLIKTLFDIKESDPPNIVMKKIERNTAEDEPLSKHFLGFFFGIKWTPSPLDHLEPDIAHRTAFITLKNLLERISQKEQIVLIFEDICYADSGTIDWLEYFAETEFKGRVITLISGENIIFS